MLDREVSLDSQIDTLQLITQNFFAYSKLNIKTEEDDREKGKLYKPQTKYEEKPIEKTSDPVKLQPTPSSASASKKESATKKNKTQEKKKSNLELFKEELRQ